MDFNEIYHLLFETYLGVGILVGAGLVISIIVSVILELRTRKIYKNHEVPEEDEWSIFEEEVEEAEAEEEKKIEESKKDSKA